MNLKKNLGQYFTTHYTLQSKVYEFILNNPTTILEPSIGQGDLIKYVKSKNNNIVFDMFEIDSTIHLLEGLNSSQVIYADFIDYNIEKKYVTIIGNPPFVRTKNGNLYIDFVRKCYHLLENNGELIFIVPSDFFKLTSASELLNQMINNGSFTHIYHNNDENLFENASIDVIVFRYCKNANLNKIVKYNDNDLYILNTNGLITFEKELINDACLFEDYFDIYVGLVSGKEEVYKNDKLGNITMLNGKNTLEKYIFIEKYPNKNKKINDYLLKHKEVLMSRKIRKFKENNWFEWGAPRNLTAIKNNLNKDCIYIYNLTRKKEIAFINKVQYFGGGLIMLCPKININLSKIVSYLNSDKFKNNFLYSNRFKIGHRQISKSYFPKLCL